MLGINVRDYNQTIAQDFKLDNAVTYPSIYDPPFRIAAALGGADLGHPDHHCPGPKPPPGRGVPP